MQKRSMTNRVSVHQVLRRSLAIVSLMALVSVATAMSAFADVTESPIRPEANEASGLVASRQHKGVFWWHRDGGSATTELPRAAIYALRFDASGNITPVKGSSEFPFYNVSGVKNSQWEDLAIDEGNNLWVGEIGANDCTSTSQMLYKLKEPNPLASETLTVLAKYPIKLPPVASGCTTANAEAMFWLDGKLYVFDKHDTTTLYRVDLPAASGQAVKLVKMGVLAGGVRKISGSSISDDRQRMVVEHYGRFYVYESSNPNLKGDAYVKDMISRSWRWDGRFLCDDEGKGAAGCDGRVEGAAFARGSHDIAFVAEDRRVFYAKPANYGDKSGGSTIPVPTPTPPPPTTANCAPTDLLVNPCRPWLGAAANTYSTAPIGNYELQVQEHEKVIGRQIEIAHTYNSVGKNTLNSDDHFFINRPNTLLYKNWKPASKWADADGSNSTVNAGIDKMADSIKSYAPKKIFLTIHHEPENDVSSGASGCSVYKGNVGTPAQYRAMWQNVRKRFDARGATNVVWAMNYQNYAPFNCMVDDLYPGNNLVDWIMFNAYGYGNSGTFLRAEANIRRFHDLMAANQSSSMDVNAKPWGIIEWNIHDMSSANAQQYYVDMKDIANQKTFPKVKAYIVYDAIGTNNLDNRIAYTDGTRDEARKQKYISFAQSAIFKNPITSPPASDTTPPSVPTGLRSTAQTTGSISLSWAASTDNVGVKGYIIKRNGVEVARVASNSYIDTGLAANTAYSYVVATYDAAGNMSAATSAVTVSTAKASDAQAPTAPSGLTTSAATTQVKLSWVGSTDNTGVTGYIIQRNGATVAQVNETTTTYSDSGLSPSTQYAYAIRARDAAGNVSSAATVSVTTKAQTDAQAPSTPSDVRVSVTQTQVNVAWNASRDNVGVKEYVVYRNNTQKAVVATTTFGDATVTAGAAYAYSVAARDAAGNTSARSVVAEVTVPAGGSTPEKAGLAATYYPTQNLSGVGVNRTDSNVNFNWGESAPLPDGFPSDNFSVRWSGRITPTSTNAYTFYTQSDDGVRLWVDNKLIIDKWVDQGVKEHMGTIDLKQGVAYNIVLEYYDKSRGAVAKLLWSSKATSKQVIPKSQLVSSSHALSGAYYKNTALSVLGGTRLDSEINFTWLDSPMTDLPANTFGVRWTGKVYAPTDGNYTFYSQTNDGVRLWVDGKQIINDWTDHGTLERAGTIYLTQGKHDLRMDFYDNTGAAVAKLLWSGPGIDKSIVPKGRLYDR